MAMGGLKRLKGVGKRWVFLGAAVVAVGVLVVSRPKKEEETVAMDFDGETIPTMFTRDALSYVSDSGYVKYLIKAPVWYMFNEAAEPNWKFNEGLYCEQYDRDMNVVSTFVADSAVYLSQRKLWEFVGNVRMNNVNRDRFATQLLFWDERNRKIYSDSFIHIEKSDRIIEGYGFESDDRIEVYTVKSPTMIIPVSDFNREREAADSTAAGAAVEPEAAAVPAEKPTAKPPKPAVTSRGPQREVRAKDAPLSGDELKVAPSGKAQLAPPR